MAVITSPDSYEVNLVESIPQNLTFNSSYPVNLATYQCWKRLIALVSLELNIASFYWTLNGSDIEVKNPSSREGEDILNDFMILLNERKLKLNITQDANQTHKDSDILQQYGATVKNVNIEKNFGGVLHTKFWVVDGKHFYVGSANMDWRSLTQVKELGLFFVNCEPLAADLNKIFAMYSYLGDNGTPPQQWPKEFVTQYNIANPMTLILNSIPARVYIASAPKGLCAEGRTNDLESILYVIQSAKKFIHIAVMDYEPAIVFGKYTFWPIIDDALRSAAIDRHIEVQLLCSKWPHTNPNMLHYLASLSRLNGVNKASISVKLFVVPATPEQQQIPYARVNHNKYMVTDNIAYVGTSNWSGDYFLGTAGVSIAISEINSEGVLPEHSITNQLQNIFTRDWTSEFAVPLSKFL